MGRIDHIEKVNKFLGNILSQVISVDLHKIFGDLERFIVSMEVKEKCLVIIVSDPAALFVIRKMGDKIKEEFPNVDEIKFFLSK